MLRPFLNFLHVSLSRSRSAVRAIIVLRNQCNAVIRYYLVNSPNSDINGENWIVDNLAPQCSTVFDVGANKGEWTSYFITKGSAKKFILFEPSLTTYQFLVDKFKNVPEVTIVNKAVSDTEGESFFFEEPDFGETSSLISSFSNDSSKKTLVKISTVDAAAEELGIEKIDYLKIDVEGFDLHVIRGARRTIEAGNVTYIQFEYNEPWALAGSTLASAIGFLKEHKYETFLLKKDGLYRFNYNRYKEFFGYSNFFSTPIANIANISHLVKGEI